MKGVYPIPNWITDYHKKFRLKERAKCFKTCSKCGRTLLKIHFNKDSRSSDGLLSCCKDCKNLYYREQREKCLEKNRSWRIKNLERLKSYQKEYREENRELFRKKYLENREVVIEKAKKYYQEHKEACQIRSQAWKERNRAKIREYNRRYREKHAVKSF